MSQEDYRKALRMGQKSFRSSLLKGRYPYLQVLDDVLVNTNIETQESLGLVNIPLDLVVGTRSAGRQTAFAPNFMPLLDAGTEFALKWISLCRSHVEEGIHTPIKAFEFMGRFYVEEGNKRVSVLKYFSATSVPGTVTRLIPRRSDSQESKIYYEFLEFYRHSGINFLWFTGPGRFKAMLALMGKHMDSPWSEDDRLQFETLYYRFDKAIASKVEDLGGLTTGDVLYVYTKIYGWDQTLTHSDSDLRKNLPRIKDELLALNMATAVKLSTEPSAAAQSKKIASPHLLGANDLKIAFVHEKDAHSSPWTMAHEHGRHQLEQVFPMRITTKRYDNVVIGENDDATLETAVADGCDVIFTTTPQLMPASLRAAVKHPHVKILNCSLNMPHPTVRTYYGRFHEAKFILGAIAGTLSRDGNIGYVADYPILGVPAAINAFALGARMVNPRARIKLKWTCLGDDLSQEAFLMEGITIVSGRELKSHIPSAFTGLYQLAPSGTAVTLAEPFWKWGKFYERIVRSILNGTWKQDVEGSKAINYWWGFSAEVIDVLPGTSLPSGVLQLAKLLKQAITSGNLDPFAPPLVDQYGKLRLKEGLLLPADIMQMDWLMDNVAGSIPTMDQLIPAARPLVSLQGLSGKEG